MRPALLIAALAMLLLACGDGCAAGESESEKESEPDVVVNTEYVQVSAGLHHTCALRTDGTVACWGSNMDKKATPSEGESSQFSAGPGHSCALRTDGSAVCWG